MDRGDHPDFSTPKIGQFFSGKKEKGKKIPQWTQPNGTIR
jgi:hypothetical protein